MSKQANRPQLYLITQTNKESNQATNHTFANPCTTSVASRHRARFENWPICWWMQQNISSVCVWALQSQGKIVWLPKRSTDSIVCYFTTFCTKQHTLIVPQDDSQWLKGYHKNYNNKNICKKKSLVLNWNIYSKVLSGSSTDKQLP